MTITALYNKGMTNKTCVYPNLAVSLYTWVQEQTDERTDRPYVLSQGLFQQFWEKAPGQNWEKWST